MWIVSYIWNNEVYSEKFKAYDKALARYGILVVTRKNPSIHFEEEKCLEKS